MTISTSSHPRKSRLTTPAIVFGSLFVALGLTAFSDTTQAQRGQPNGLGRLEQPHSASELRVLDWSLWYIAKYYVEPDRIDPKKMTRNALEGLERSIPQVLVTDAQTPGRVRVRVGTTDQEFRTDDVEALWTVGKRVRKVFRFVARHSDLTEEELRKAEYAIVEGVLSTLDPHTNLLRPEAFESMRMGVRGNFGGLGIEVGTRDGKLTVIRVIDGNPADKVGLKAGDQIVQIEEESTVTMGLQEAVDRLRGEAGTNVVIHVRRAGLTSPKKFTITRDIIKLESVIGNVLPGTDRDGQPARVGLLQIKRNFSQTTGKELREKLADFEKQGVRGIVLDMRDNPGGLLTAAVEVADAFLQSGTIVSTVGGTSPRDVMRANDRYDFPNLPIVVLINEGSASATEIVAGALRNLDRAVLLGRRSFGKGSVQVLHDRKLGEEELALKLTIAQYLTPGDISIQSVGVSPDLETIPVLIGKEHIAYFGRKRFDLVREEALADHLTNDKTDPSQQITAGPLYFRGWGSIGGPGDPDARNKKSEKTEKPKKKPKKNDKAAEEKSEDEFTAQELLEDPEIRLGRDLVLWAPAPTREKILASLDEFVDSQASSEQDSIRASLTSRGIDWSAGPKPAAGTGPLLRMSLKTDRPNNTIPAGEKGTVIATVTNEGSAPAYQVRAISDSDYGYLDERELFFGRVDPGQSRSYKLKLSVTESELTRTDTIDFRLFEQHGAKLAPGSTTAINISGEGLSRPQFAYGFQILDDPALGADITGNGDGALQVGERARLRVSVKNIGEGKALDTWINLRNLSGDALFLHTGRERIKELEPGQERVVLLDLEQRKLPEKAGTELELSVADTKVGVALTEKLVFPISQPSRQTATSGAVETAAAVDLYASVLGSPQLTARSEPGAKFKLLGETSEWYRVQLAKDRFAFARKSDVQSTKRASLRDAKVQDAYSVSPPKITLSDTVSTTAKESIQISGVAEDDQAVRDVFIGVYNPSRDLFGHGEKVFYQASQDPSSGRLEFAAEVPLMPGNNLIDIRARENGEVVSRKRMWVLRTSGLEEARAGEGSFKSDGKLKVDTFGN